MEEKIEFLFSEDNYKYVDLEINEENLLSCEISKKIDIEKNEAINLLPEKTDFHSLELCDNYSLYYNNRLFLVRNRVQGNWYSSKKEKFFGNSIRSSSEVIVRNFLQNRRCSQKRKSRQSVLFTWRDPNRW